MFTVLSFIGAARLLSVILHIFPFQFWLTVQLKILVFDEGTRHYLYSNRVLASWRDSRGDLQHSRVPSSDL